jgi:hypothetical protein
MPRGIPNKKVYGYARCLYCGEVFERTGAAQNYCSKECVDAAYAESCDVVDRALRECQSDTVDGWKVCAICGRFFKPDCPRTKYCSPACVSEAKNRGKVRRRKEKIMRQARKKPERPPAPKTDGFTWEDIRKVFAEFGITSYHKALAILEQRRKEETEND